MVRRTKTETEQTRLAILAAARETFLARGVSGTTLEMIAVAAGVTRGAIYWHFRNKKALFDAMRAQVCVPLIDGQAVPRPEAGDDPLRAVERFLGTMFEAVTAPGENRQTFEIMAFKCEYVGEFGDELERHRRNSGEVLERLAAYYARAQRRGLLRRGLAPRTAATESLAFVIGLIRFTLLDPETTIARPGAAALIAAHIAGRRAA